MTLVLVGHVITSAHLDRTGKDSYNLPLPVCVHHNNCYNCVVQFQNEMKCYQNSLLLQWNILRSLVLHHCRQSSACASLRYVVSACAHMLSRRVEHWPWPWPWPWRSHADTQNTHVQRARTTDSDR